MATMVLDAHALMVLFNDEPGAEEVEKILIKAESGNPKLLISVVHWG
jgi:PIN domain nuclease of toxin-antitoxin system